MTVARPTNNEQRAIKLPLEHGMQLSHFDKLVKRKEKWIEVM